MKRIIIIAAILSLYFAGNAQSYLRDYQIELHMDTVWLYDGDRLVGQFINSNPDSKLDSIILKDNL